jgi:hypothetical protein
MERCLAGSSSAAAGAATVTAEAGADRRRLGRRAFVGALLAPATALLAPRVGRARRAQREPIRIGVGIDDALADAAGLARGARLGGEEAGHTASLLRRELEIVELPSSAMHGEAEPALDRLHRAGARILVAGAGAATVEALAHAAARAGVLVLNIAARADRLRTPPCEPLLLHVVASRRMQQAALAEWRRHDGGADSDVVVEEWHPGLRRFGAEQLNDRHRDRYGSRMSSPAWIAWLALKIAAEAELRARGGDGLRLASYLLAQRTHFDGHKGWPLSFRALDRQLRQPLYVVRGGERGEVVFEVPDTRRTTSPDALDALGRPDAASGCALDTRHSEVDA